MKIYVINLLRALDRRAKMEVQAEQFGVRLDFIEATDGRQLTEQQRSCADLGARRYVSKYPLTDNEIGCWLSHRKAMQHLLDSGDDMAVILEDDAKLLPGFVEVLAAIEAHGPTFDVIDLHRLFKKGEIFRPCGALIGDFAIGRIGLMHMHATSYVMSRAGAKKFLKNSERFAHAVDKDMHRYWANGLNIYGLNQRVVLADDGGVSFIEETRKQDTPAQRVALVGANSPYWWLQRKLNQLGDSLWKRLIFSYCVRQGKVLWNRKG